MKNYFKKAVILALYSAGFVAGYVTEFAKGVYEILTEDIF